MPSARPLAARVEPELAPDAFDTFYRHYFVRVLVLMRRHFPGCDAEDVAQETMARCYAHFGAFDPGRDPWPWVASVARNAAIDAMRRNRRLAPVEELSDALAGPPCDATYDATYEALLHRERSRTLARALGRLKPADRQLIEDHDLEGIACAQIAAIRDLTPNALRQQLHRARRRLAVELRRTGGAFGVVGLAVHARFARVARRLNEMSMATGSVSESALGLVAAAAITSSVVAGLGLGGTPARSTVAPATRAAAAATSVAEAGAAAVAPAPVPTPAPAPVAGKGSQPADGPSAASHVGPVHIATHGNPTQPTPYDYSVMVDTPLGPTGTEGNYDRIPGWMAVCYFGVVPC